MNICEHLKIPMDKCCEYCLAHRNCSLHHRPMKYTVFVTRTNKYVVEVEAESATEADQKVWDMHGEWELQDSDDVIEYITDENGLTWHYTSRGRWVAEKKAAAK